MGACPSTPNGLNLGCGNLGELRLPKRAGCHDCFVGELLEAQEDNSNPVETQASSAKVFAPPTAHPVSQEPESPTKAAASSNSDFARLLGGLPPEGARARVEGIVRDWREKLRAGIKISLNFEKVMLSYDPALQCLDAREHGTLYPLAALHECTHLPRATEGSPFELRAEFNDSEALVFQFRQGYDRAAFALTLHSLSTEARKDKWHEDWAAEGWDEESDMSVQEDGTNSTAEPEDDAVNGGHQGREPHGAKKASP